MINNTNIEELHLSKVPIILAIAQIRFTLPEHFNVESFLERKSSIDYHYPEFKTNFIGQLKIQDLLEGKHSASFQDPKKSGFLFESKDKKKSFSIELNKFTFNNTGKYVSWESFFEDVLKSWRYFDKIQKSIFINGVSLRFINEITINEIITDPLDYFNYTLFSKDNSNLNEIDSYFVSFTYNWGINKIANFSHNIKAISTQENKAIIDIDVLNNNIMEYYDESDLIQRFNELRMELKTRFFNSITTKLLNQLL